MTEEHIDAIIVVVVLVVVVLEEEEVEAGAREAEGRSERTRG